MSRRRRIKSPSPDPDQPLRAAVYARVSTDEQAAEGHSIEAQLRITREFVERKGWVIVREYVDPGYSGSNDNRPAFQQMIQSAIGGEVQVICFHKLDRFSRSISDILHYFRELDKAGILLASATEPFDFTTPAGKAQFHMLAVFAQWYIDNLSAETKKGKKQRALKGLYNGRLPFGYVKDESGVAQVVPEEAEIIRRAYDAYSLGNVTDRQIAEMINNAGFLTRTGRRWSKDSVRDFLQNEFYLGYVKYGGDLMPGKHEAIIDQEVFDKCQRVRTAHRRAPRSHAPVFRTYLLTRIIRCARCGQTIRGQSCRGYRYYREATRTRGLQCEDSGTTISAAVVEGQLGDIMRNLRLPDDWQEEIRKSVLDADERKALLERKQYLEGKLHRLGIAFADGVIDQPTYERERDAVQAELAALVVPEDISVIDAGLYLETLHDLWDEATLEEQKEICQLMLETVYFDMRNQQITALVPRSEYVPLFREIEILQETEDGRFRVRRELLGA